MAHLGYSNYVLVESQPVVAHTIICSLLSVQLDFKLQAQSVAVKFNKRLSRLSGYWITFPRPISCLFGYPIPAIFGKMISDKSDKYLFRLFRWDVYLVASREREQQGKLSPPLLKTRKRR